MEGRKKREPLWNTNHGFEDDIKNFEITEVWRCELDASDSGLVLVNVFFEHNKLCYNDSLCAGWSGDRIPIGEILPANFQPNTGVHTGSCTMGTLSFSGGKPAGVWL